MDAERDITKEPKCEKVNIFSRIYCTWLFSMYFRGLKREIQLNELYKNPPSDDSEELCDTLERNWNAELKGKNPSFVRASLKTFGWKMLPSLCLFSFEELFLRTVQPFMLAYVIQFFAGRERGDEMNYPMACLNAAGVVGCSFWYVLCHHPACYNGFRVAIKVRVAWCTLMYRKAIRLNSSAFAKTTIGQILNLMSNDVNRIDELCNFGCYLIVAPLQTLIGMYIIYLQIGYVCFIGLTLMLLFIPFNSFNGRIFLKLRTKVAALSDTRIRYVNEIIKGMRVIKMYAWEKHFSKLVSEARRKEMVKIRNATFLRAMNISISTVGTNIILFAMLITYIFQGNSLNADKVFVVMTVMNTLRRPMTWLLPNSLALLSELYVSCKRIQNFLLLEEIGQGETKKNYIKSNNGKSENSILVKNIMVQWTENQIHPTLYDISVNLQRGELLAVIGSVGAGKSTFLMSLMNEIDINSGTTNVNGNIAYASQEPWSFNGSVLQNILFGKKYDERRFREVIKVCAMTKDLEQFDYGEKTLVGDRGVALSGGQKARITLARALYNDADIYLLDDPLSAVDSEVANHIFEKCITGYLKNKTVVLVTHQIQFIRKASKILVLKEGKQHAYGTYDDIINAGVDLVSVIQKPDNKQQQQPGSSKSGVERTDSTSSVSRSFSFKRSLSVLSTQSQLCMDVCPDDDNPALEANQDDEPKVVQEQKVGGSISARVYLDYVRAGSGILLMSAMIISTLVSQGIFHYTDIWLSNWSNKEDSGHNRTSDEELRNGIIYSSLIAIQFVGMCIRSATFFSMCIYASINLHNRIFYCLMRAPITFFDVNPTGRILNRFTKDMGIIDEQLPLAAYDLNLIVTQVIGATIVVAISKWYLVFPAIVMIIFILVIRAAYIKTARDMKRYEGLKRSPLYNQMTTTLNGLATIRAFEAQPMFIKQYYSFQNDHTATYFTCCCSSRLLGICMDCICIAYIACVVLFLMAFYEGIQSGTAGLALSMALGLTGVTQFGVRQSAEVENHMTSVERVIEYSKLPTEAELTSNYKFSLKWPEHGAVTFDHVYLTYENSPSPVLKDLCFSIRGGEKIGIVGRTGAGKSSIMTALFRMVEIEGRIVIDGVNCNEIGLHELRSKISIIPQEPMSFIGTLRNNLDPFDEHSDEAIWSALEKVQLKEAVNDMPGQLQYLLSEGGGNLSVGQRQLICLARALLRSNRILVLDEATANVDHRTDMLIQKTIRQNFTNCTVLTIAHRLNTIIDSDRIIVLDAGRLVEFDTPYNLLKNREGTFYMLVQKTGPQMAAKLTASALQTAE